MFPNFPLKHVESCMDPLEVLNQEVVEYIWTHLTTSELLVCRAVSRNWRESVQSFRGCWGPRGFDDFLKRKMTLSAWDQGRFKKHRDFLTDSILLVWDDCFFVSSSKQGRLNKYDSLGRKTRTLRGKFEKMAFYSRGLMAMSLRPRHLKTLDFYLNVLERFNCAGFDCYADTLVIFGGGPRVRYSQGAVFYRVPRSDSIYVLDGFLLLRNNSDFHCDFYHFITEPKRILYLKSSPLYIPDYKVYKGGKRYCIKGSMSQGDKEVEYTTLRVFESDRLLNRFDMAEEVKDCLFTKEHFIILVSNKLILYDSDFKSQPVEYYLEFDHLGACRNRGDWFYAYGTDRFVLIDPRKGLIAKVDHPGRSFIVREEFFLASRIDKNEIYTLENPSK